MPYSLSQDHEDPPVAITPAIVIGIGESGRELLAALEEAAAIRPGLANTHAIWTGPDGWSTAGDKGQLSPWSESTDTVWQSDDDWWAAHEATGRDVIQRTIERAQLAAESTEQTLDIYLVGHLQEPATQGLWLKVLTAARAASIPFSDHVFTLFLAADSRAFSALSEKDGRSLKTTLSDLTEELQAATDRQELPGRVGWCYLVDTINKVGYPIKPVVDGEFSTRRLQAHLITEFIAHLESGLRERDAYRRLSLANLHRDQRMAEPLARTGTFAAGSLLYPVVALGNQARDELAQRLLVDHFLGLDQPSDLPEARLMREQWLAEPKIDPTTLRHNITRDSGGHPVEFEFELPEVRQIYDDDPERLPGILDDWEDGLQQRWEHAEGPPQKMATSAQTIIDGAGSRLDQEMDSQLQEQVGGLCRGGHFLREAEIVVLAEQQKDELTNKKGCLTLLLSAIRLRPDLTIIPDLEAARERLEQTLEHRVNRRAVWTRASIFAVVLLSFLWTAYLAAGEAVGLHGFVAGRLGMAGGEIAQALELLAMTGLCWLITLIAAWITIYRKEGAIIRAAERFIDGIRQKYKALLERTLLAERQRVYDDILAKLGAWREDLEGRRQTMNTAVAELDEALANRPYAAPLLTERLLLEPEQWPGQMPRSTMADDELAERYLVEAARPNWREETPGQLLSSLRNYAARYLNTWREKLALKGWTEEGNTAVISSRIANLRKRLLPAWQLDREERMSAVVAGALVATNGKRSEPLRTLLFVGLPPACPEPEISENGARKTIYRNGEPGRLTVANTLHGLRLNELAIWQILGDSQQITEEAEVEVSVDVIELETAV